MCVCVCRLKKDLKGLLVVHPAWYIRALLTVVKPFIRSLLLLLLLLFIIIIIVIVVNIVTPLPISEKFGRKIRFIQTLQELSELVPTDRLQIPDAVRQ